MNPPPALTPHGSFAPVTRWLNYLSPHNPDHVPQSLVIIIHHILLTITSMVSSASNVNLTFSMHSQKQAVDPLKHQSNLILYGVPQ